MHCDKGQDWIIGVTLEEFKERSQITQLLARNILDHKGVQEAFGTVVKGIAQVADMAHLNVVANKTLSSLGNVPTGRVLMTNCGSPKLPNGNWLRFSFYVK